MQQTQHVFACILNLTVSLSSMANTVNDSQTNMHQEFLIT